MQARKAFLEFHWQERDVSSSWTMSFSFFCMRFSTNLQLCSFRNSDEFPIISRLFGECPRLWVLRLLVIRVWLRYGLTSRFYDGVFNLRKSSTSCLNLSAFELVYSIRRFIALLNLVVGLTSSSIASKHLRSIFSFPRGEGRKGIDLRPRVPSAYPRHR